MPDHLKKLTMDPDMDSEHVRTLTNKMADLLYINH